MKDLQKFSLKKSFKKHSVHAFMQIFIEKRYYDNLRIQETLKNLENLTIFIQSSEEDLHSIFEKQQ